MFSVIVRFSRNTIFRWDSCKLFNTNSTEIVNYEQHRTVLGKFFLFLINCKRIPDDYSAIISPRPSLNISLIFFGQELIWAVLKLNAYFDKHSTLQNADFHSGEFSLSEWNLFVLNLFAADKGGCSFCLPKAIRAIYSVSDGDKFECVAKGYPGI